MEWNSESVEDITVGLIKQFEDDPTYDVHDIVMGLTLAIIHFLPYTDDDEIVADEVMKEIDASVG